MELRFKETPCLQNKVVPTRRNKLEFCVRREGQTEGRTTFVLRGLNYAPDVS